MNMLAVKAWHELLTRRNDLEKQTLCTNNWKRASVSRLSVGAIRTKWPERLCVNCSLAHCGNMHLSMLLDGTLFGIHEGVRLGEHTIS